MKKTTAIISLVFLISCINAIQLNAGDSYSIDTKDFDYYEITGNTTYVDLEINNTGEKLIISLSKYSNSDNFTITFYEKRNIHHSSKKLPDLYGDIINKGSTGDNTNNEEIYLEEEGNINYIKYLIVAILILITLIVIVLYQR